MAAENEGKGVRYYVLKSAVGTIIMRVEFKDITRFFELYDGMIIGCGITLEEAIEKSIVVALGGKK
jgi:hypothetical protein